MEPLDKPSAPKPLNPKEVSVNFVLELEASYLNISDRNLSGCHVLQAICGLTLTPKSKLGA